MSNEIGIKKEIDRLGRTTRNFYDELDGKLLATVNESSGEGTTYTFIYDIFGNSSGFFLTLVSRYGKIKKNDFVLPRLEILLPATRRFLSADRSDVVNATPMGLTDKNLFAYCDNNTTMRADKDGEFWNFIIGAVAISMITGAVGGNINQVCFETNVRISTMKKIMFFPLWKIESVEKYLQNMEANGYRLEKIKHSYFFYFKESTPKQMCYFLSCKSFWGKGTGSCDYALESEHKAHAVESKMSFYTMYRTKDSKENLSFLYGARLDYIKSILLERALTSLFLTVLFSVASFLAISNAQPTCKEFFLLGAIIGASVSFTFYYFYGYFKQKNKCKKYERDKFNRRNF